MKFDHTPGLWKFNDAFTITTDENDPQTIAYCSDHRNSRRRSKKEQRANAALMAAAPKLLEEAVHLLGALEYYSDRPDINGLKQAVKQAIGTSK